MPVDFAGFTIYKLFTFSSVSLLVGSSLHIVGHHYFGTTSIEKIIISLDFSWLYSIGSFLKARGLCSDCINHYVCSGGC